MYLIALIPLITHAYGRRAPYPMGNSSTTLRQPTFGTTVTISVRPGSTYNPNSSVPSAPYLAGGDRGVGTLTTAPAVANLSSIAIQPSCKWNCSSPVVLTPTSSPVVFSSVPWNTEDDPSLPSVTTIWPRPDNSAPPETSSPPPSQEPPYIPTPQTITDTVNVTVNLGGLGCGSSTSSATTSPSVFISQSSESPTPSSGLSFSSQTSPSTTSASNGTASHTVHRGHIPVMDTRPGTLGPFSQYSDAAASSSTGPITSFTTPTTTPTATIKVTPITD